jgi:hypothetical protein
MIFGDLPGMNGALAFFSIISCQLISLNHRWFLTSAGLLNPSRFAGLRYSNLLMKSAASIDHSAGKSCFLI